MLDLGVAHFALRDLALTLVVCTTGPASVSATATGFARASGSFVADGFKVGMEVVPAGFSNSANNTPGIVAQVTATDLTITGGRTAEGAGAARSLTVGLPTVRIWENLNPQDVAAGTPIQQPVGGRPYLEEDFVPATSTLRTNASNGVTEDKGLYVLRWYGLSNVGSDAIRKSMDGLRALFAPGKSIALSDGNTIRFDAGQELPSQIRPLGNGWSVSTFRPAWHVYAAGPS